MPLTQGPVPGGPRSVPTPRQRPCISQPRGKGQRPTFTQAPWWSHWEARSVCAPTHIAMGQQIHLRPQDAARGPRPPAVLHTAFRTPSLLEHKASGPLSSWKKQVPLQGSHTYTPLPTVSTAPSSLCPWQPWPFTAFVRHKALAPRDPCFKLTTGGTACRRGSHQSPLSGGRAAQPGPWCWAGHRIPCCESSAVPSQPRPLRWVQGAWQGHPHRPPCERGLYPLTVQQVRGEDHGP